MCVYGDGKLRMKEDVRYGGLLQINLSGALPKKKRGQRANARRTFGPLNWGSFLADRGNPNKIQSASTREKYFTDGGRGKYVYMRWEG